MGRIDEAITEWKEAIQVTPDLAYVNFYIGYSYALKEDYAETMKWIDRYIEEDAPAQKVNGYLAKAFFYFWLGNSEPGIKYLSKVGEIAEKYGNEILIACMECMKYWLCYNAGELEKSRQHLKSWYNDMVKSWGEAWFVSFVKLHLG